MPHIPGAVQWLRLPLCPCPNRNLKQRLSKQSPGQAHDSFRLACFRNWRATSDLRRPATAEETSCLGLGALPPRQRCCSMDSTRCARVGDLELLGGWFLRNGEPLATQAHRRTRA